MNHIEVWGVRISRSLLSSEQMAYLEALPVEIPAVEWVWQEMDRVWDELGLDNRKIFDNRLIADFYNHPVWLMNGIFTSRDPESISHRSAIARFLINRDANNIADYGGGAGELASMIVNYGSNTRVTVIEPYPSQIALSRFDSDSRITIESELEHEFDAIVAQDVLEHVIDPVGLAYLIADRVRIGGVAVFANCFRPVIKCHLPSTFHLRHTFVHVMTMMGLRYAGVLTGTKHVQIFERTGSISIKKARRAEKISKLLGPLINALANKAAGAKRLVNS